MTGEGDDVDGYEDAHEDAHEDRRADGRGDGWLEYADIGGDSGISHYRVVDGAIDVRFKRGAEYRYRARDVMPGVVDAMRWLAAAGDDLNRYLNEHAWGRACGSAERRASSRPGSDVKRRLAARNGAGRPARATTKLSRPCSAADAWRSARSRDRCGAGRIRAAWRRPR